MTEILQRTPPETAHSTAHQEQTANIALELLFDPYYSSLTKHFAHVLACSSLYHDRGYLERQGRSYWTGTQIEHPEESVFLFLRETEKVLSSLNLLFGAGLIYNHDNPNYCYPAYLLFESRRNQRPPPPACSSSHIPGKINDLPSAVKNELHISLQTHFLSYLNPEVFLAYLTILQEADSRLADAERTTKFCQERGIPLVDNLNGQKDFGIPAWQSSGVANILLALNTMLRCAKTPAGQEIARSSYSEGIQIISSLLNYPYPGLTPPEIDLVFAATHQPPSLYWDSIDTIAYLPHRLQVHYQLSAPCPYSQLISLEQINISGDRLPPAIISTSSLNHSTIWQKFLEIYALDLITQIPSAIVLKLISDEEWITYIPPVVTPTSSGYILRTGVDAYHLAQKLKKTHLRVCLLA